jgi:hypothetical protein
VLVEIDGQRQWQQHTIDTSWSQAHSLLLADVNGDGTDELIAGKRYLGHDGQDIGEYDALGIYYYRFDPKLRSWHVGNISSFERTAFGLDPTAADVDGDGDVDIVVADRSGLYLCENAEEDGPNILAAPKVTRFINRQRPLVWRRSDGNEDQISTPTEWAKRRQSIGCLGVEGDVLVCV